MALIVVHVACRRATTIAGGAHITIELLGDDDAVRPFAEAMVACDGHKLELGAGVRSPGAQVLAALLRVDRTLLEIDLSKSELGAQGGRDIGTVVLSSEDGACSALQSLVLAARYEVQSLKTASELDLSKKKLQPADAGLLAAVLAANTYVIAARAFFAAVIFVGSC